MLAFETKDWPVGKLDESNQLLSNVKQQILQAVPSHVAPAELLVQIQQLAKVFQYELEIANEHIGLREAEIDFAADGFQNILYDVAYRLFELNQKYGGDASLIRSKFDFDDVYQAWLDASARILTTRYTYTHDGVSFELQVIYNAYGRVGFQVTVAGQTYYVLDSVLACPAANYMKSLTEKVAYALREAFLGDWRENR